MSQKLKNCAISVMPLAFKMIVRAIACLKGILQKYAPIKVTSSFITYPINEIWR
jgi:hypothetical protein